jgi:hypothetical protein
MGTTSNMLAPSWPLCQSLFSKYSAPTPHPGTLKFQRWVPLPLQVGVHNDVSGLKQNITCLCCGTKAL